MALDIPETDAAQLTDALVDWADSDDAPRPFGAEDAAYSRGARPYRTAADLLIEESELRTVQGFTPEIYQRIRPFVCALPFAQLTDINVNTMTPADAPVLSAIYLGGLPVETARRIVAGRPAEGWSGQTEFLQEPLLEVTVREGGAPPSQQLAFRSRFFALEGSVQFASLVLPYSALLEAHPSGLLRTSARRWTAPE